MREIGRAKIFEKSNFETVEIGRTKMREIGRAKIFENRVFNVRNRANIVTKVREIGRTKIFENRAFKRSKLGEQKCAKFAAPRSLKIEL